jgi:hypothetical protein
MRIAFVIQRLAYETTVMRVATMLVLLSHVIDALKKIWMTPNAESTESSEEGY